jgi:hypothetical protein
VVSGAIVVDYEELHRLSRVWSAAAVEVGRLGARVAELAASPAVIAGAVLDPIGSVRAAAAITGATFGRHGLAALSGLLAADAIRLDAAVAREQLVDDLPVGQLAAFTGFALTLPPRLAATPLGVMSTLREGRHRSAVLADAATGYLAPFTEPLLAALTPSFESRADLLLRRPTRVDPVLGLPIGEVAHLERQGPGAVAVTDRRPPWAGTAPASLADAMGRVADLEAQPAAELAIQEITCADGVRRYVVELPGIRDIASRQQPQDLLGAVTAMAGGPTTYARCVREALDAAEVPVGAQVMLVGHSDGGIVAMELAADPAFNGSRVEVTHVIAAGAPISGKQVAPLRRASTRVLSVENVNDVVTHLDGVDGSAIRQSPRRLVYQYSSDEHSVGINHAAQEYAEHMQLLATSPNPAMREFQASAQPYLWSEPGATSTIVFTLADRS